MKDAKIEIGENTLQIVLKAKWNGDLTEFEKAGLKIFAEKYENNEITLVISPSGVTNAQLEKAAKILSQVLLKNK